MQISMICLDENDAYEITLFGSEANKHFTQNSQFAAGSRRTATINGSYMCVCVCMQQFGFNLFQFAPAVAHCICMRWLTLNASEH